ncbi:hypothetical protein AZ034_005438, partial [Pluralibacter gergoviae]
MDILIYAMINSLCYQTRQGMEP